MKPILAILLLAAGLAHAQVPRTISFQGAVSGASDQAIAAPVPITFSLYTAASGGAPLWTETHGAAQPVNGIVSVLLGSLTPLNLPFDQPYFLGIAVGGEVELTPRAAVVSSPYAIRSVAADALASPIVAGNIGDWTIPLDRLGNSCAAGQILVRSASGWQCLPGP